MLGFRFKRAAQFGLPSEIRVDNQNQKLHLPSAIGASQAFIDIFLDDCYGLEKLPHSINKILDVGAHVGLFSLAARRLFPAATIHAYEPNLNLEPYLKSQAHIGQFQYFLEAVGLNAGKVFLDIHKDSVSTRSIIDQNGTIPQIPFRTAVQRIGGTVDLVKLDCEGAEWDMLKDVEAWQNVKHITMEYHLWPAHSHEEIISVIKKLGFMVTTQRVTHKDYGILIATRRK